MEDRKGALNVMDFDKIFIFQLCGANDQALRHQNKAMKDGERIEGDRMIQSDWKY